MLALAGTACGQGQHVDPGDGPLVVGTSREKWEYFELLKLTAALDFRYEYRNDKLSEGGQPSRTSRETRYREVLDLSTDAAIGHKNLLEITGSIQLGREDISFGGDAAESQGDETDFVNLYDINALIMGTSALPTNVWARREQSLLDRPFATTIDETTTEEGIGTRFQSSSVSASAQYFHRDTRLKGDFGDIDTKVAQDTLTLQGVINLTSSQRLEATYTYDQISESQASGYSDSYGRHDANLVHTYAFGPAGPSNELRSSVRLFNQSGRQSQDHVRWDESLTLRHSDRFETRYNTVVDSQSVRDQAQQLVRAEVSAKYRLFESLTSVGTVGGQQVTAPGGFTSQDLFVSGVMDYTKAVPMGRLDAAVGAGFDAQSNSDRGSSTSIINEAYTFIDGFPVIIPRRNIIAGSIVITPPAGFPVYQEGVDYTVAIFPDHAEIRGIVGGGFVNGQTLLVSYDTGPEPGSDIDTTSTNLSVRYTLTEGTLRGLSFYSTYRTVGHSVSADDPTLIVLDDVKDFLAGIEYRFSGFDVKYEYNNHDSTFDPYTVHRLQALYTLPMSVTSSLSAEFTHELIDFTQAGDSVTFDRGSLRWNERLNSAFDFNARLEYRREDSTLNGLTEGFDQIIGFTWIKGRTNVYGSVRNSFLDGPDSHQTSQALLFGIRRTF